MAARRPGTADRFRQVGYLFIYQLRSLVGSRRPLLGSLKLTHDCNLSCQHCPFRRKRTGSLSFQQVRSSLVALYDRGVRILIFEGGEPFVWRDGASDIRTVVAEAKKLFFSVGVTTNGTFPLDVDSDILWVSVDGLRETHDEIRGASFDRIMANIESSSHPKIYAHITINTLNWREIPDLVEFLSHKVRGVTIQFHYPFEEVDQDLYLPFASRRRVLDDLIGMKRQGLPIADSYACLSALKENKWKCRPWMIASVDPDGRLTHGCYVKHRGEVSCERCGFSTHTELSLAHGGVLESVLVGSRTFFAP